jgi:DNA-binding protein HU-beta
MNKSDLTNEIANSTGLTKAKASETIDAMVNAIETALSKGEKVTLVGFGTWETSVRQARKGRNPKTNEVLDIPSRTVARFRAGSNLSKQVNG